METAFVLFLIFLFVAFSSFWVFVDAPRYGMTKWWGIGAFFFWILFFPLYLLVRTSQDRLPEEGDAEAQAPPPGWYRAPGSADGALERWWDGQRWTEHERQIAP